MKRDKPKVLPGLQRGAKGLRRETAGPIQHAVPEAPTSIAFQRFRRGELSPAQYRFERIRELFPHDPPDTGDARFLGVDVPDVGIAPRMRLIWGAGFYSARHLTLQADADWRGVDPLVQSLAGMSCELARRDGIPLVPFKAWECLTYDPPYSENWWHNQGAAVQFCHARYLTLLLSDEWQFVRGYVLAAAEFLGVLDDLVDWSQGLTPGHVHLLSCEGASLRLWPDIEDPVRKTCYTLWRDRLGA